MECQLLSNILLLFIDLVEEEQSFNKACVRDLSSCQEKTRGSNGSRKKKKRKKKERKKEGTRLELQNMV